MKNRLTNSSSRTAKSVAPFADAKASPLLAAR